MSITLEIPDDIIRAAQTLALQTGSSPEKLLVEALRAHFPPVDPELQAEFDAWERAADEDAARLETHEGLG